MSAYGACLGCGNSREQCECKDRQERREVRRLSSLGREAEELQLLSAATPLPLKLDEMK